MSRYTIALELATKLHAGQTDLAGKPYIDHVLRVADAVSSEEEKIIALLHDTLEDTPITFLELENLFGKRIASVIQLLTKIDGEPYGQYIERVATDPLAIKIKLADLEDNINRFWKLPMITLKDLNRKEKYRRAKKYLENVNIT